MQPPRLTHTHLAVASGLPFVGVSDLDLHHRIRGDAFEPGVGLCLPFGEGREIDPGPLAGFGSGPAGRAAAGIRARRRSCVSTTPRIAWKLGADPSCSTMGIG